MPWSPKQVCCEAGCSNLVAKGRCEKHSRGAEFYGTRPWREFRARYLLAHPWCVRCKQLGHVVHHIRSRHDFPKLALIESNCQTMCKKCHDKFGTKASHDRR